MEYNLIGKVLGDRYEILEVIGSGGMATVYKARCRLLNRYVAVKVLKDSLKNDEEVVRRFTTESRAAASISHHNIVSVFDVGETAEGLSYIVMEYVDGITLKEYIKRNYRLPWREACEFASQIAMALECAHEHGIIHRDIKPHNILLTKDHTLKVADFGIARTVGSDTVNTSSKNGIFGSVHYISPEQARGGYVDAASDVYSLGIVLYEMLAGRVPFDGENAVSVALMKLENDPEDVRNIVPDIPDEVGEIVMKAIAKEQHIRYQSAADMAYDLREVLDASASGHIQARDVKSVRKNSGNTVGRQGKINKKFVIIVAVIAVVLGIGSYAFFTGGKKEYRVPDIMDKTLEEAIIIAEEAGFEIDEENISYLTSDEYPEGNIMKQTPGANTYVKKAKPIKVVISQGLSEGDIEVPSVVGLDYAKAAEELRKAKLQYKKVEEDSTEYEKNQVISQSPVKGTKVTENYVVILHVSTGEAEETPEPNEEEKLVKVPKLTGNSLENAEAILKASGLKRGNISREDSELEEGTVISQSPKSGSESPEGSYVNLVVSTGNPAATPEPTPSPTPNKPAVTKEPAEPTETLKKKTIFIDLPQTESGSVHVKAVANGATIHDQTHQCSEGQVALSVAARTDATVEVYFDGVLQLTKVVEF